MHVRVEMQHVVALISDVYGLGASLSLCVCVCACVRACVCVCGYNKEHKEHSKRNYNEAKATNQKWDDQQPHNQQQVQKARGAKRRQDHITVTNIHKTRH
jgi:hypothetical protein